VVECNISRKKYNMQDVRPSKCCAKANVVLSQKFWRALIYMNWIDQLLYVQPKWLTESKCMSLIVLLSLK